MKTVLILILSILLESSCLGLEAGDQGPKSKNWVLISDTHFVDIKSAKRIKQNLYQARVCHSSTNGKNEWWVYFNVRVDCSSRHVWLESGDGWIESSGSPKYVSGLMNTVCK